MTVATWLAISVLQDQGIRDTVVMIPAQRDLMETLAVGGQFVVSIVVVVLLGAIVFALVALRKSMGELTRLLNSSSADLTGAAHAVRNVAEDVRGITQSVKTDVGAVSDTIRYVNGRVRRVVRRAEDRIDRLEALAGVVQDEAEDFVLSSTSALRGVRLGAAALKRSFLSTRRRGLKRKKRRPIRDEGRRPAARTGERPNIRPRVVDPT
jgi:methyl-accepting chemotaxis protein